MYYIVPTEKSFEQASGDLAAAVAKHGFGVLHMHDLGATLRSKGTDFAGQCRVFEICNPLFAAQVLRVDLKLNMALPCRVSVYTDNGVTQIGTIPPADLLAVLSSDDELRPVAAAVETTIKRIIDETAG